MSLTTIPIDEYNKYYKNDITSHFICRLAYCRNEELRKWFLQQETRFFQMRLRMLNDDEVKNLLQKKLGTDYKALEEKDEVWEKYKS
jgi:DNA primase large subunit